MNQELEQYLWFFMDYRQKDWLKQLAIAKFVVNSQVHITTKISLFIANYSKELRMGADIKRMKKMKKNNRICKRKQKRFRKKQDSIKKSTRRNKTTSRLKQFLLMQLNYNYQLQ